MKTQTILRKRGLLIGVLSVLVLGSSCASTFLVSKDCNTYYFGSTQEKLNRMLCATGDLQKILDDANLLPEARESLYRNQCIDRSRDGVVKTYAALSRDQKAQLMASFRKFDYEINSRPAGNFHVYPREINPNFCPPYEKYQGYLQEQDRTAEKPTTDEEFSVFYVRPI